MHGQRDDRTTATRGRAALVLGLAGALALSGVAAAGGSATTTPSTPPVVERAELVADVDPGDIRSGDEDLHADEPEPASPPVALEAGRNRLGDASPWTGLWGPEIEPLATYEPQTRCISGARPAVAAFAQLLEQAYPQGRSLGISRACDAGARSEHKEGRAYDWGLQVTVPSERMAAEELAAWLLATDEHGNEYAMARRLGVMYVIWDGHIWSAGAADEGWRVYRGPSPHTDHVHLSFSWAGAIGSTSFWDAARLGPWLLGDVAVERLPSSFDLGRDRYRSELGDQPGRLRTWGTPTASEAPPADPAAEPSTADDAPADAATPPPPAPDPTPPRPVASEPAPIPTPPADEVLGPVLDPLPEVEPLLPDLPPPTTTPIVDDVGEVVEDVTGDLEGTADGLLGG